MDPFNFGNDPRHGDGDEGGDEDQTFNPFLQFGFPNLEDEGQTLLEKKISDGIGAVKKFNHLLFQIFFLFISASAIVVMTFWAVQGCLYLLRLGG